MPAINTQRGGIVSNIMVIIGLIIIAAIIIWGAFYLTRLLGNLLPSLSWPWSSSKTIEVSVVPASVESGTSAAVRWQYPATKGFYTVAYGCVNGASIKVPGASGPITLPCDTQYSIPPSEDPVTLSMTPIIATATATIPLTVTYRDTNNNEKATGSASISVTNSHVGNGGNNGGGNNGGGTPTPVPTPTPSGKADLVTTLISFDGIVLPNTGAQLPQQGQPIAIKFDIKNIGSRATGTWYFTVTLPTKVPYTFTSTAQQSLAPGSHIVYTLNFDRALRDGALLTIKADAGNQVIESNEANNTRSYILHVTWYNNQWHYSY